MKATVQKMEDIKAQVGQLIREARKARGLSQREVAEKLGVSDGTYSRYENGKANLSLETIDKVAKAIGTQIRVVST